MSLDVYLHLDEITDTPERHAIFIRRNGQTVEISRAEWERINPGRTPVTCKVGGETSAVYRDNITHNLNEMAEAAGLYKVLWHPEDIGAVWAKDIELQLKIGLDALKQNPDKFKAFNPQNGWGDYDQLVEFVENYLSACQKYPNATIEVSR